MSDRNEPFIADPTDHLLAVIDDRGSASAAERKLMDSGFQEVHVYQGRDGAGAIDSAGAEHGVAGGFVRGVQQALSNKDNLAEYEQAVIDGAVVIAVRAEDDEARDRAADILERHSAHSINHFGKAIVRTIKA